MNDVWEYDIPTGIWTWRAGNDSDDVIGFYGIRGEGTNMTRPGARLAASSWFVGETAYIFGGLCLGKMKRNFS